MANKVKDYDELNISAENGFRKYSPNNKFLKKKGLGMLLNIVEGIEELLFKNTGTFQMFHIIAKNVIGLFIFHRS